MPPKQSPRTLGLKTPLGEDVLLLTAFRGEEGMSRLFRFELQMLSDNNAIQAADLVGKNVTWSVKQNDGSPRHFNGFVSRFFAGDEDKKGRRAYRAEVVPWLWFLTRTADCRIFQDKTVVEIIEQIFADLGFSDFEKAQVKGSHPQRTYCVQYRETDFNFVSRLMEEEGIFYFFKHQDGKHLLVLGDQKGAYADCTEKEVDYPQDFGSQAVEDFLVAWEHQYEFTTGKWAQTDYNFEDHPARSEKTPSKLLMTEQQTQVSLPGITKYEVYDFPGEYAKKNDGDSLSKWRMEEEEAGFDVVQAGSLCKSFTPGGKFKVRQHLCKAEEKKSYVITAIEHRAIEPVGYESLPADSEKAEAWDYSNRFTCIPDSVNFRPERTTRRPLLHGLQTAVVVGPAGEEIYTDKYGRVKVQFFWDREGQRDDKTTCWIRVAQMLAGKNWGAMAIPRIGQEVVVSFQEGDPDQPLVVGSLYNADQMPPYTLPDEKTKTYLKTNSSPGGDGYNELRLEDKAGKEQIFLHAQRNMDVRVRADSMETVVGDRHLIVGTDQDGKSGDQCEMIYRDKHLKVHRDHQEHVGGDMKLLVGGIDGPGNQHIIIQADKKESVGGSSHLQIAQDRVEKIDLNQSLNVGMNQEEKVGLKHALEAGTEIHLKAGMTAVIEAGVQLTLKVGSNFIDINPAGIFIQGVMVNINSGGAAGSGSGSAPASPQAPDKAAPAEPQQADAAKTGKKSAPEF
jgi:type VI secretion system secreted protein VgrG